MLFGNEILDVIVKVGGGGIGVLVLEYIIKSFLEKKDKLEDKDDKRKEENIEKLQEFRKATDGLLVEIKVRMDIIEKDIKENEGEIKNLLSMFHELLTARAKEVAEFGVRIEELYRRITKLEGGSNDGNP